MYSPWMKTMNRCLSPSFFVAMVLSLLVGALLMAASASAQMMVRQFPANVKRGVMTVTAPPQVMINGSALRLSPGVRIHAPNNLLVMSGALIGQQYAVNYRLEQNDLVREIWILNQAEVDAQPRGWDTVTNIRFASDGDKPKVDDGKTPYNQLPGLPKQ
jgi:hypothetical protein